MSIYQHADLQNIIFNSLNQSDVLVVDLIAFDLSNVSDTVTEDYQN